MQEAGFSLLGKRTESLDAQTFGMVLFLTSLAFRPIRTSVIQPGTRIGRMLAGAPEGVR